MITQLIATPSVSSVSPSFDQGNRMVIDLLASWCESLGFSVEIQELSHNKANLIATLGSGSGGLILSGHTDTVPYDDTRWNSDPFIATERDQRIYGLGTADMKSFLALALHAALEIDRSRLTAPLIILATADEESSMSGAKALVKAGKPRARYAVIGEPTGMRPVRMHKGIFMEGIHIHGLSGHSSDPSLGHNALEAMHHVMRAIIDWRNELQQNNINHAFAVPVPTINLGHIHGGDNPNRICANCELHIDMRPLPGMDIDELREELHHRARTAVKDDGFSLSFTPLFSGSPAMETPANSTLVQLAEQLTGNPSDAVAFGTEAPYLQQLGNEVIVLGPGSIDQAHQPDEYLPMSQISPMIDILKQLIHQFCMTPAEQ